MIRWTWAIAFMTACVYEPPVGPGDDNPDDQVDPGPDPQIQAACLATGTRLCLEFEVDAGMLDDAALDGSGNGFDAVTNDVVTYQRLPAVDDSDAAGFSLTSTMTIAEDIEIAGSVTLEMWAQTTSDATLFDSNGRFYMSRNSDNQIECGINNGDSDQRVDGRTSLNGNWFHVACTFDASSGDIKVYVNGDLDDCKKLEGRTIQANPGATTLHAGLLGAIDAVRLYDGVVTASEICKSAGRTSCNEICPIEDSGPSGGQGGFNGGFGD